MTFLRALFLFSIDINEKHRQSKQVQRDSTELFEVLYFREHTSVVEDSVIFSFKQNGFLVYIPKFGLKSPVYLRDSEGKLCTPLDANGADGLVDFSVDENANKMLIKNSKGGSSFVEALDHVSVGIRVLESRAHLPPLKFQLVKFGAKSGQAVGDGKKNSVPVNLKQAVLQDQKDSAAEEAAQLRRRMMVTEYLQSSESTSFYSLVDQFSCLSLGGTPGVDSALEQGLELGKAPPFLKQIRGRRSFQKDQLQLELAKAGLLRHHDALVLTGAGNDDEEEYWDEEDAPYEPIGSTKVSSIPGSAPAKSPVARVVSVEPKQSFTPFRAKGIDSTGSSGSSSSSNAPPAAAPKKAFVPFKAKGPGNEGAKTHQVTYAGGHAMREQAVARGDAPSEEKLLDKAVGTKYKETIRKVEQGVKAKSFQAFKAKKRD